MDSLDGSCLPMTDGMALINPERTLVNWFAFSHELKV